MERIVAAEVQKSLKIRERAEQLERDIESRAGLLAAYQKEPTVWNEDRKNLAAELKTKQKELDQLNKKDKSKGKADYEDKIAANCQRLDEIRLIEDSVGYVNLPPELAKERAELNNENQLLRAKGGLQGKAGGENRPVAIFPEDLPMKTNLDDFDRGPMPPLDDE